MRRTVEILVSLLLCAALTAAVFPVPAAAADQEPADYEEQLLPIMGWSSWNRFGSEGINEEVCLRQIELLEEYGLARLGYTYLNIDDGWQGGRDPDTGLVRANQEKFPNGMKYIADAAHNTGLKAGIYTDAGADTCASVSKREGVNDWNNLPANGYGLGVGLYGHDDEDLRLYFDAWGYDFLKVDFCGGVKLGWNDRERIARYTEIGSEIEELSGELGRDLNYNVCCWTFPWDDDPTDERSVADIITDSNADSWRTGGDLWSDFESVLHQTDRLKGIEQYARPGAHHDLDMLQIGRSMTHDEDTTHFIMWCMASSPLLIGADLAELDADALELLKNTELIALDQDPACLCAKYIKTKGDVEVWGKDLGKRDSETKAIALMNRGDSEQTVSLDWTETGILGTATVRDLLRHKNLNAGKGITVTLPSHATAVFKVSGEGSAEVSANGGEAAEAENEFRIGRFTAEKLLGQGAVLLDVRSEAEYSVGHTENAVNLPWGQDFVAEVEERFPDRETPLILACSTGKRSYMARDALSYAGYTRVWDLGSLDNLSDEPEIRIRSHPEMIFPDTPLTVSTRGAEYDETRLWWSLGADSGFSDAAPLDGAFSVGAAGPVTVKAYLTFDGEVIATTREDYLVFDDRLPEPDSCKTLYLSNLSPIKSYVSYGELLSDSTVYGNRITIAGRTFEKGVAAHAPSELVYRIPTGAVRFTAAAGCDDEVRGDARYNIRYKVFVDGVQVDRTVLLPVGCYYVFDIALEPGSSELRLVCEPGVSVDHNNEFMHAEWAGAAFELDRSVTLWKIGEFFRCIRDWCRAVREKIISLFSS